MVNFKRNVSELKDSKDYSLFKFAKWNRKVSEAKVKTLVESIKNYGVFEDKKVISVNGNYEIIDGQHRFEAFKRLGLPVSFVIDYNASIKECAVLNSTNTNWTIEEYIRSFSNQESDNKSSYVFLIRMNRKYPKLSYLSIAGLSNSRTRKYIQITYNKMMIETIKSGSFFVDIPLSIIEDEFNFLTKCLEKIGRSVNFNKKSINSGYWIEALHYLYMKHTVDKGLLLQKLDERIDGFYLPGNGSSALQQLEDAYNYRLGSKNKLYLVSDFNKQKEENRLSFGKGAEK